MVGCLPESLILFRNLEWEETVLRRAVGRLLIFLFIATPLPFGVQAQSRLSSRDLLDQIRAHRKGIAVWWTGNDGWLIKSDEILIGTDLDLDPQDKIHQPPLSAQELSSELDVAFVTHHHGDHFNTPTLAILAQRNRCTFVLPLTCLQKALEMKIPRERIIVPQPGQPFEVKGIRVEPLHAIHGNQDFTVLTREADFIESIAHNCGYVFNLQGKRFFEPGDSVLTEEHLNLKNIDVLFVSPTVHNMYIDRSMILINRLEPAYIFPQHFGTYRVTDENRFWTKGYPDELKLRLSRDLQKRYHILEQGEMFEIH
jgi:L-ascorbate metabolism protein UlaG (beta-lactamase superfamily)